MHDDLKRVFDHFQGKHVAIIGSAASRPETANDIDVLVPHDVDFPTFVRSLGVKYNGWDTPDGQHVRRANYRVPGVNRTVQLIQHSTTPRAADHPQETLLRDGTLLNAGKRYDKPAKSAR